MTPDRRLTALETWTMEMVESVLPEGTPEQKQRLAIAVVQARAKEDRYVTGEIMLKAPHIEALKPMKAWLMDRENKLEQIGLAWAECWPPNTRVAELVESENSLIQ